MRSTTLILVFHEPINNALKKRVQQALEAYYTEHRILPVVLLRILCSFPAGHTAAAVFTLQLMVHIFPLVYTCSVTIHFGIFASNRIMQGLSISVRSTYSTQYIVAAMTFLCFGVNIVRM